MIKINEIYNYFDKIGCLSFSTLAQDGYVESRIAHFIAFDDEGLYFTTMSTKPFYKQLKETSKVSACGMYPNTHVIKYDKDNLPHFEPGYTARITGDVRELTSDEIESKAKNNKDFNVAVFDIKKYPATKVFVLYRARGEIYDYDFEKENRDHKLERERFSIGSLIGARPGLSITNKCISCGKCYSLCSFNAIKKGEPYKILGNRCDECGTCYTACPRKAIVTSF